MRLLPVCIMSISGCLQVKLYEQNWFIYQIRAQQEARSIIAANTDEGYMSEILHPPRISQLLRKGGDKSSCSWLPLKCETVQVSIGHSGVWSYGSPETPYH